MADCAPDITNRRLADADAYRFTFDSDGGRIVDFLQLRCEISGVTFVYRLFIGVSLDTTRVLDSRPPRQTQQSKTAQSN